MEEKKKRIVSAGVFSPRREKGLFITLEVIAPAMVMAYVLVEVLKIAGVMPLIGTLLSPVMAVFGLPGEASVALLAAFFAKAAGAATAASMYAQGILTAEQATILSRRASPWGRSSAISRGSCWCAACGRCIIRCCWRCPSWTR